MYMYNNLVTQTTLKFILINIHVLHVHGKNYDSLYLFVFFF